MHRALAGAFASDLSELMGGDRVELWIHGHLHRMADLVVAGTRVVSNPRGYPHEPVEAFDPTLVVEVWLHTRVSAAACHAAEPPHDGAGQSRSLRCRG